MKQLTLSLKMTTAQVVEMSVTAVNNSPIQDCCHPDNNASPTYYEMIPGLKPFTVIKSVYQESCTRYQAKETAECDMVDSNGNALISVAFEFEGAW